MKQGGTEQAIVDQARRSRTPIPASILNKPELRPGLEFYYIAFWELATCRQFGMGEGPIPWSAVYQYAQSCGLTDPEFDLLLTLLKHMDTEYLKYRAEQRKMKK